jgi:hypothetical protein
MLYLLNLDTLLQGRDGILLCQFVNRHDIVRNRILCKKIALFLFLKFQEDNQDFKKKKKKREKEKKVSSI